MTQRRRRELVTLLRDLGHMNIKTLMERLDVSEATIRRDLTYLAGLGVIQRTWGGAAPPEGLDLGPDWAGYSPTEENLIKARLARRAASLVKPGQLLSVESGGTTLAVARALLATPRIKVLTNSLRIAYILNTYGKCSEVHLTGGTLLTRSYLCGPLTQLGLRHFRVDLAFVGAQSLSLEGGITDTNPTYAEVKRALIRSADRVILVSAPNKFDRKGSVAVETWRAIDVFVTTRDIQPASVDAITRHGVDVLTC